MDENLTSTLTPTPTPIPIVIEFSDIDLSGITANQESIIEELTTQNETLAIVLENQQTQIERMESLYLEVELIALMIFLIFMWKWIKRLYMKRRQIDV